MATTLRYPYEIRDAKEYFDDIPDVKVEPDMLKLAQHILQNKATDFDPSQFVDHYEEAVVEMLKKKQAGLPVSRERARRGRRTSRTSWTRSAAALQRKKPHPLRRRKGASGLRDRARCCFPLRATPKRWRRNAVGTAARSTKKCRLTICDRCPIAARKSRRRLETKIKLASGASLGVP